MDGQTWSIAKSGQGKYAAKVVGATLSDGSVVRIAWSDYDRQLFTAKDFFLEVAVAVTLKTVVQQGSARQNEIPSERKPLSI